MFRAMKSLRLFAVLILGGILVACAQSDLDKKDVDLSYRVDPNQPICAPSDNIAVCFFAVTNPQGDHSPEPVRDAIKDALTLPLEELRTKRYANYQMEPNQWTFEEVIGHTFAGGAIRKNGDIISTSSEGFLEAIKQSETIPVLEKLLADFEEGVREYKELEAFRRQNEPGN